MSGVLSNKGNLKAKDDWGSVSGLMPPLSKKISLLYIPGVLWEPDSLIWDRYSVPSHGKLLFVFHSLSNVHRTNNCNGTFNVFFFSSWISPSIFICFRDKQQKEIKFPFWILFSLIKILNVWTLLSQKAPIRKENRQAIALLRKIRYSKSIFVVLLL